MILSVPELLDRTRVFTIMQLREAEDWAHAGDGHVGLHLHSIVFDHSPSCFRKAVARGEHIAHAFCQNVACLKRLGNFLGVKVIFIDKPATPKQHLDLCGRPLKNYLSSVNYRHLFLMDRMEASLLF